MPRTQPLAIFFIETEFVHAENSLLARRRPRSHTDKTVYAVHTVVAEGEKVGAVQYETDRSRFLGRGRTPADPIAVTEDRPLSNTVGAVLDPVFSLRHRVRLQPNETARVTFTTAVANSREEALMLADKYHDVSTFEREEKLAWTQAQVEMRHLNVDPDEVHLFQRLASRVLYLDPSLRPHATILAMNKQTQSALWPYGISGDLPIVIVRISELEHLNMVRQIIRGHEYLRMNGLSIDLVILNDRSASYIEVLQDELQRLIRPAAPERWLINPAAFICGEPTRCPSQTGILLHAVARLVIVTERGPWKINWCADQLRKNCPRFIRRGGRLGAIRSRRCPRLNWPSSMVWAVSAMADANMSLFLEKASGRLRRGLMSSPTLRTLAFK
ncbi:MAG: hypothetical protein WKF84_00930 [Pyrinomonadaceae bacterium]